MSGVARGLGLFRWCGLDAAEVCVGPEAGGVTFNIGGVGEGLWLFGCAVVAPGEFALAPVLLAGVRCPVAALAAGEEAVVLVKLVVMSGESSCLGWKS